MIGICSKCGAPLQTHVCEYCGYIDNTLKPNTPENNEMNQTDTNDYQYRQHPNMNPNLNAYANSNSGVSDKSKVIALVLCIFTGIFGGHRFYVGKFGSGVLYFLTNGLFIIGWVIDLIQIITGTFKDSKGLPLKQ